jgi:hypothetical protein
MKKRRENEYVLKKIEFMLIEVTLYYASWALWLFTHACGSDVLVFHLSHFKQWI